MSLCLACMVCSLANKAYTELCLCVLGIHGSESPYVAGVDLGVAREGLTHPGLS